MYRPGFAVYSLGNAEYFRSVQLVTNIHPMNSFANDFEARRVKALELLAASGIRQSNYLPAATALLWRLGVKVRPPHFYRFAGTALVCGLHFGLAWGLFMWLVVWSSQGLSVATAFSGAVSAGAFFGLAMAAYYAYGRKKHRLPPWEKLLDGSCVA